MCGVGRARQGRSIMLPLLVALGWCTVIAITFVFGYQLAYHDTAGAQLTIQALQRDNERLSSALESTQDEVIRLERAHRIDLDAKRLAQEQLGRLQQERLDLLKQVSYLERLVRNGGAGILQIQEFRLLATQQPEQFTYRFTVAQLIPGFGESAGEVRVLIAANQDEELQTQIAQLDSGGAAHHQMRFEHFQQFQGTIVVPEALDPQGLKIELEPSTRNLMASSTTFPWQPERIETTALPAQALEGGVIAVELDIRTEEPHQMEIGTRVTVR